MNTSNTFLVIQRFRQKGQLCHLVDKGRKILFDKDKSLNYSDNTYLFLMQ